MGIFNQKSKFRVATEMGTVRQKVEQASFPHSRHRVDAAATSAAKRKQARRTSGSGSARADALDVPARATHKRRRLVSSRSPASPSFSEDDSGDGDEEAWEDKLDGHKRRRRQAHAQSFVDEKRAVRHPKLWTGGEDEGEGEDEVPIVHAVAVISLSQDCEPALGLAPDEVEVELRYPGARYPERWELVKRKQKLEANERVYVTDKIAQVVKLVACHLVPEPEAGPFLDPDSGSGIQRRLERARNIGDGQGFKAAIREYNERILTLQRNGTFARHLDSLHGLPKDLVGFVLEQVYDRTISPKVELLTKYKNGTDNVYGELLHPLVSDVLTDKLKMRSDMVFVDLGSGVGNVVLQAALEIGCESWGCEMMENACGLAEEQEAEFVARCRLWGLAHGRVRLERGDFRSNEPTLAALRRADVVLVNNQAFTPELNGDLISLFLDLKPGCRLVSLKTFVHDNKKSVNDVAASILQVEHLTYPQKSVSWTSAAGTYCISTRR